MPRDKDMGNRLDRPIFFIGMPRSGTTILFEALGRHPDVGWPSNYCQMYPKHPWINVLRPLLDNRTLRLHGHKRQYGSALPGSAYLPQPAEAYAFWDRYTGINFSRSAMIGCKCSVPTAKKIRNAVRRVLWWQRKKRLAAKLTGPPRLEFLHSIFPDAIFVNVIRDGRAVVHSLLNVPFWRQKGGMAAPFWEGVLSDDDINHWQAQNRDPGVLAALQWKRVIELTQEARMKIPEDQYFEISYENFIGSTNQSISNLLTACKLHAHPAVLEEVSSGAELRNMNMKYSGDWSPEYQILLTKIMNPTLNNAGYE